MDDLKASMDNTETVRIVHQIVKNYAASVGMVINTKKSAIQLNNESQLPESLREIPRMDESTYKYLGFEMKRGEVETKEMMKSSKRGSRRSWRNPQRWLMYLK